MMQEGASCRRPVRLQYDAQKLPCKSDKNARSAHQSQSLSSHTTKSLISPNKLSASTPCDSSVVMAGTQLQYDLDFDLDALKKAIASAERLEESGYASILARSAHSQYGTGWMVADQLSDNSSDTESLENWGSRTRDGMPIVSFPDTRTSLPFQDYCRLISYLLAVPPLEDSHNGYIIVADRRLDKWASVRSLLTQLDRFFPQPLRAVLLLKPEGVLQRAMEVGYRTVLDACQFHDIERMKASAAQIAASLDDFSRCLRDTELPNDADTTRHVLDTQRHERDAIKEDFRIASRKGVGLLRGIRQHESKPRPEQLSPTRLNNVTAIERMLVQLDETERSFDRFWLRHERRLLQCLELRRFEDEFRKLQASFATHMLYLEEHREVGESVEQADILAEQHREYMNSAMTDCTLATSLRDRGAALMADSDTELEGSLLPKCDELNRMGGALTAALGRRERVLLLSREMHQCVDRANSWCDRSVSILTSSEAEQALVNAHRGPFAQVDKQNTVSALLGQIQSLMQDGASIDVNSIAGQLKLRQSPSLNPAPVDDTANEFNCFDNESAEPGLEGSNNPKAADDENMLLLSTTTDTRTLLLQVSARLADMRRVCALHCRVLERLSAFDGHQQHQQELKAKPVQAVSPEKKRVNVHDAAAHVEKADVQRTSENSPSDGCPTLADELAALGEQRTPTDDRKTSNSNGSDIGGCKVDENGMYCEQSCEVGNNGKTLDKATYVIRELVATEQSYVEELRSVVDTYVRNLHDSPVEFGIPPKLVDVCPAIFGNIEMLCEFHERVFLRDLELAARQPGHDGGAARAVAACFIHRRPSFDLYIDYCRNKPHSERIRSDNQTQLADFMGLCQRQAGHRLPIGAYLLKPVQRVTKYQLLLKELQRSLGNHDAECRADVKAALDAMLELLDLVNATMHTGRISGFQDELSTLGPLLAHGRFTVYTTPCKTYEKSVSLCSSQTPASRKSSKAQSRHIFLFTRALLLCKHRTLAGGSAGGTIVSHSPARGAQRGQSANGDVYEMKCQVLTHNLRQPPCAPNNSNNVFLWCASAHELYTLVAEQPAVRDRWSARLNGLLGGGKNASPSHPLAHSASASTMSLAGKPHSSFAGRRMSASTAKQHRKRQSIETGPGAAENDATLRENSPSTGPSGSARPHSWAAANSADYGSSAGTSTAGTTVTSSTVSESAHRETETLTETEERASVASTSSTSADAENRPDATPSDPESDPNNNPNDRVPAGSSEASDERTQSHCNWNESDRENNSIGDLADLQQVSTNGSTQSVNSTSIPVDEVKVSQQNLALVQ